MFWFLAVRRDTPGIRYDNQAEVVRRVGGWHDPIPALIAATPAHTLLCHDIEDLDPVARYVDGRVALLGDAAHAMTPFLGHLATRLTELAGARLAARESAWLWNWTPPTPGIAPTDTDGAHTTEDDR